MKSLQIACLSILTTVFLFACSKSDQFVVDQNVITSNANAGTVNQHQTAESTSLADSYIIVFKEQVQNVDAEVEQLSKRFGIKAGFKYKNTIKGFSAKLPAAAILGLSNNPNIDYIEQDQVMSANTTQTNPPSWGINRIDQNSLPLGIYYNYTSTGVGVNAYIFDSGILLSHNEFGARASCGFFSVGIDCIDQNGHGTHVAGTVGGTTFGVAKEVNLIAVRVLDINGSGSTSGVIAGIDWATGHHLAGVPSVGNMSLGGGASTALDAAVKRAIADGIVMCVAAGNNSKSASNYSPARVTEAITVGATGSTSNASSYDVFASYSNFGSVVDILAPGSLINSSWIGSNTTTKIISGTSMATPHVAGVVALYISTKTSASPAAVQAELKSKATLGKITGVPRLTTNSLLYTAY